MSPTKSIFFDPVLWTGGEAFVSSYWRVMTVLSTSITTMWTAARGVVSKYKDSEVRLPREQKEAEIRLQNEQRKHQKKLNGSHAALSLIGHYGFFARLAKL